MRRLVWRLVEARLQRALPASYVSSAIGDLAEDYANRRRATGEFRAAIWLLREMTSLVAANQAALPPEPAVTRIYIATEIRFALRRLRARTGASLAAAGLLGIGIGLCTAAFSAVDAVLLAPAPFRDADRLVRQIVGYSEPDLIHAWRTGGFFEAVEAARVATFQIRNGTETLSWSGADITPGVFDLLGVRPIRGRTFGSDRRAGPSDEIMISEGIWRTVFGGDASVLGRRIALDDGSAVVVGIMPASFRFPAAATEAWRPFVPMEGERGESLFTIFGRLKPGVPREEAEERLKPVARELARLPRNYSGPPLDPVGAPQLGRFTGRALWFLLAGAALVFAVLCANVSGLVFASLSARQREYGMCTALGASRPRLVREATIEHGLVGIAGAASGVCVAWGLTNVVPGVFQGHTLNPIDIDYRALAMASVLGVAGILLSGLVPAWLGTRTDPLNAIRTSRQAGTETRAARFASSGLIVAEIALACSLLVGSALLLRSFVNLVQAERGLNASGIVRISVTNLDSLESGDAMKIAADALESRFAAWPAIAAVALSREVPPGGTQTSAVHLGPPGGRPDPAAVVRTDRYRVGSAFFDLYEIPIVRGRTFQPGDTLSDVVVSERLAALLWPGADPLGRSLAAGSRPGRVIGVAREIRLPTLDPALDLPEYYTPLGNESRTLYLNIRCRGTCPNEAEIRAQVQAVHPNLRAGIVPPAESRFFDQLRLPRATAEVASIFAIVAVVTTAGGLFTVLTYAVERRRREFGVRAALGASPRQIHALVVRDAMAVVTVGVGAGSLAGWLVARSLAAFHYGVTATDSVTWTIVLLTVATTSLAAAWRPARRAGRTDPSTLLHEE